MVPRTRSRRCDRSGSDCPNSKSRRILDEDRCNTGAELARHTHGDSPSDEPGFARAARSWPGDPPRDRALRPCPAGSAHPQGQRTSPARGGGLERSSSDEHLIGAPEPRRPTLVPPNCCSIAPFSFAPAGLLGARPKGRRWLMPNSPRGQHFMTVALLLFGRCRSVARIPMPGTAPCVSGPWVRRALSGVPGTWPARGAGLRRRGSCRSSGASGGRPS